MSIVRSSRIALALMTGLALFVSVSQPVGAHSVARVHLTLEQAGFIIGKTTGYGYVRYHGKRYRLRVTGVRVGAIAGISSARVRGRLSNISRLGDIVGTYYSFGASASAGAGGKNYQKLRNANGAYLELYGIQDGVEVSLDMGGLTLELAR